MSFKKAFLCSVLILAIITLFSCDKSDYPHVYMKAELNGGQEVPPNSSVATGKSTATYNSDSKTLQIVTIHNVASPTGAHIHRGKAGVNGPVVFDLAAGRSSVTSPIIYTSPPFTKEQEDSLLAGGFYVNIHSTTYPAGEIRGQLVKE